MKVKEIRGQVEKITYCNDESGFTVARIRTDGGVITIVGVIPLLRPGDEVRAEGSFEEHPLYGQRFKVRSLETISNPTKEGIERYLSSGTVKGLGPVMAKRIVEAFGEETLSIIEANAERLKEVHGIGERRVELIRRGLSEERDVRDIFVLLMSFGITRNLASKIHRIYGRDALKILKENPYKVAEDVKGIGFQKADRIAQAFKISKDSPFRLKAAVLYGLEKIVEEGHTCFPLEEFLTLCERNLKMDRELTLKAIRELKEEGRVELEHREETYLFPSSLFLAEEFVAQRIKEISRSGQSRGLFDAGYYLEEIEREIGLSLSQEQKEALSTCGTEGICIVTGGPGTGKTTLVKALMVLCKKTGLRPVLCAPTGRAAKRLSEVTATEARTIHRLLEFSPEENRFRRNEKNPLSGDVFIVDEVSMVDLPLMYHFIKALPGGAKIVLVGDADQLPSVGPGNVLRDLIASGTVKTIRLRRIFRQSSDSLIVLNAHRINNGLMPFVRTKKGMSSDFLFFQIEEPEGILAKMKELVRDGLKTFNREIDPIKDVQILTPMHRGILGVTNLNAELQKLLNPSGEPFEVGERRFRLGDRVMQLRNDYLKDVYNGDVGSIVGVDREKEVVEVDFEGRIVGYSFEELDEISLSYACSVHKAQGSEYPVVLMPISVQHYILLQRNLLYTGITRGKKLVILIGTKKALAIAIRNEKERKRYTLLRERLS